MRLVAVLALMIGSAPAAVASEGFDLVIPGRAGVPIVVYGVDISYAVVEGDFGLGKGVHNQPTVFGGRVIKPVRNVGHYYPSLGFRPAYGRLEIEPPANRKLPHPAESYHQSWSAQSAPLPPSPADIPQNPPAVILAPRWDDQPTQQNFERQDFGKHDK